MHLFDRLPLGIFGPLTGTNSRRAWDLISRLANNFFGVDAAPPYADGYLHEQVTKEVERFLLDQRWEQEDGQQDATPLNIQANMLLRRLVETGWLVEDRVGAKLFVNMRPVVVRFFERLQQFAEEDPELIGGNVQLIYNQLRSVVENPRDEAQGFISAASLCVRLINSLSTTTVRARDLMKELTQEQETPVFVRRFFTEHISELYVRDFKDLRTENHPLRLRWDIIELVGKVSREEPARTALLSGYAAIAKPDEFPEALLERDIRRFERLLDVERFLERMDRVMEQATQRALAYLGYRLKASDRIEAVIEDTVRSLTRADECGIEITGRLMPPATLISDDRLRMPAPPPPVPTRKPMRKRELTVQERAMLLLRREMIAHRDGSPSAMQRYVHGLLPAGGETPVDQLPIDNVEDAVAQLALLRLASLAKNSPKAFANHPLLRRLDFEVRLSGERVETELYELPAFTVKRKAENAS